jgi:hypothetical protein
MCRIFELLLNWSRECVRSSGMFHETWSPICKLLSEKTLDYVRGTIGGFGLKCWRRSWENLRFIEYNWGFLLSNKIMKTIRRHTSRDQLMGQTLFTIFNEMYSTDLLLVRKTYFANSCMSSAGQDGGIPCPGSFLSRNVNSKPKPLKLWAPRNLC